MILNVLYVWTVRIENKNHPFWSLNFFFYVGYIYHVGLTQLITIFFLVVEFLYDYKMLT